MVDRITRSALRILAENPDITIPIPNIKPKYFTTTLTKVSFNLY